MMGKGMRWLWMVSICWMVLLFVAGCASRPVARTAAHGVTTGAKGAARASVGSGKATAGAATGATDAAGAVRGRGDGRKE